MNKSEVIKKKEYPFNFQSSVIARWARELKIVRFVGMTGGHANDDDAFIVVVPFKDLNEMLHIAKLLGFEFPYLGENVPQPEIGKSYTGEEMAKFPSLIGRAAPGFAQPCWIQVLDEEAFVYVVNGNISIKCGTTRENKWFEGEKNFLKALILDQKLQKIELNYLDPPKSSNYCISPFNYPEIWEDEFESWADQYFEETKSILVEEGKK